MEYCSVIKRSELLHMNESQNTMLNERSQKRVATLHNNVNVHSKRVKMVDFMSCIFCHKKRVHTL